MSDTDHVFDPILEVEERVRGMDADGDSEGDAERVMDGDWLVDADTDPPDKDGEDDGAGVGVGEEEGVGSDEQV